MLKAAVDTKVDCLGVEGLSVSPLKHWVKRPTRVVRYMAGIGAGVNYGVHRDSLVNLARGVVERVLYVRRDGALRSVPTPKKDVFKRLSWFRIGVLRCSPSTPVVSRDQYPDLYTGRKRAIYQKAYESLCTEAISRKDSRVKTFIKAEKINFDSKDDPAPRVIQPRSPRYNLEVGRYLKPAEAAFCIGVERLAGYRVITKGLNADEVGQLIAGHWNRYQRPVALGLDASRFDQHVSVQALEWEHSVYNGKFQSPELAALLKWQLRNRGVAWVEGHKVRYEVDGKRMSGDINTGLGNCLIMSGIVLTYCRERSIDCRLVNNGDDCVLIMDSKDLSKFGDIDHHFLDFGFTLTREEPVYCLEKVVFCQAQPLWVGDGYRMVRDPRTAMSKDAVSLQSWHDPVAVGHWCYSIGTCGKQLTSGVPVWESWYDMLLRHAVHPSDGYMDALQVSGMSYLARGVKPAVITAKSRVSFWKAFGLLPDAQEAFEREYKTAELDIAHVPMMFPDIKTLDKQNNPFATWSSQRPPA